MISRQTIERLLKLCEGSPRYGEWREFCQREGVHYKTTLYWRKKLGVLHRNYRKQKCPTISVTLTVP